ncbi:hypothetical protein SARC_12311 [Sphaeroforma arctica JP610]|uniref:PSP proline-rich domain-containing protein n=1 Tax=Sphaeroforma arctica JP610 TaxID=667725 RepID=A0A0L0FEI9_9EUKA|nr:hypothetical protein SARC_12311 [Sphaeroforma arctica JP610]KNC75155.1 hypothetical protein SARC_12311 [Sphaeroforma arctica JP610]|eukprot:XP_014149057.1 hypothetical protein SARC_12311 [Sphaeroforma arctica JP610]
MLFSVVADTEARNELKEALGMITSSTNVPPYYENMLMYGYPPAYITTSERFRREQAGAEQLRKDIANTTITIHLGIDSDSDGDANVADQPASLCTNTNGVESVTDVPVTGSEVVDNGNKPQRIASTRTSASQLRGLDVSPSRMDLSENEDMDVLASVNMDMSDSESESELETRSETVVEGRVEAIATTPTPDDTVGGRQVSELTTIPTTTPGDSAVAKASERVDTIVGASEGVDTMAQPPADGIDASQRNQITNEYPHAYARANELALGNRYFDRLVEFGRTEKPAHHMYAYMGLNTPPHSIEEMVDYPWNPYSPYFDVEKEQWKQSQVFYFWRQKAMRDNATSGVTTDYPHPRMYHPTTANTHTPQGILPQPHPPTHPLLQHTLVRVWHMGVRAMGGIPFHALQYKAATMLR